MWPVHRRFVFGILILCTLCCRPSHAGQRIVLQLRWDHQYQFAGYYAAQWEGYYDEIGLDVEIRPGVTPDGIVSAVTEVTEGRAQFGIGAADILMANEKGADLRVTASIFQHSASGFYMKKETELHTLKDLLRLRVARRVNDLIDVELQALLKAEGIDPASVAPHAHEPGLNHLVEGRVDVVPGYFISFPFEAASAGLTLNTFRPISYGVDFYGDSLFTDGGTVDANPDLAERFTRASLKGWEFALANRETMVRRISQTLPRTAHREQLTEFNTFMSDGVAKLMNYPEVEIGHINPARWERMHHHLTRIGLLSGPMDIRTFIFDPDKMQRIKAEERQRIFILILSVVSIILVTTFFWLWFLRITVRNRTRKLRRSESLLKMERKRLLMLLETFPGFIYLKTPDYKITYANRYFIEQFGDPAGLTCHKVLKNRDTPCRVCPSFEVFKTGKENQWEWADAPDGKTYRIYDYPFPDDDGSSLVLEIGMDITRLKQTQQQLAISLKEKNTLLQELYHRTKNNMQAIVSMINLQTRHVRNTHTLALFAETKNRIKTMALVHEKLYQAESLSLIDLGDYLSDLAVLLKNSCSDESRGIGIHVEMDQIFIPIDTAIPCGLILNELMSNVFKHAFPGKRTGRVDIILEKREGREVEIRFRDNGIGLPEGLDIRKTDTFGLENVVDLTEYQLSGNVTVFREAGTEFRIRFRVAEPSESDREKG